MNFVVNKDSKAKAFLKKLPEIFLLLSLAFVAGMLVLFPNKYVEATFTGIKVWAVNVLPSLLPFFFITALATATGSLTKITRLTSPFTGFLYRTDGIAAFVQVMSFLSGYPVGVKIAADLYERGVIGGREATKLCTFCSTSGPMFIVGSVGTAMFRNKTVGFILLFSHLTASVLCGVIFRWLPTSKPRNVCAKTGVTTDNVLYESVYSAVLSVAMVGGFIAVFFTFATILFDVGLFTPIVWVLSPLIGENNAKGVAMGIVECTFACKILSESVTPLSVSLACGAISCGGLSVWCQSAVYLNKAHADLKIFALSKLTHTVLSFALCYGVCAVLS